MKKFRIRNLTKLFSFVQGLSQIIFIFLQQFLKCFCASRLPIFFRTNFSHAHLFPRPLWRDPLPLPRGPAGSCCATTGRRGWTKSAQSSPCTTHQPLQAQFLLPSNPGFAFFLRSCRPSPSLLCRRAAGARGPTASASAAGPFSSPPCAPSWPPFPGPLFRHSGGWTPPPWNGAEGLSRPQISPAASGPAGGPSLPRGLQPGHRPAASSPSQRVPSGLPSGWRGGIRRPVPGSTNDRQTRVSDGCMVCHRVRRDHRSDIELFTSPPPPWASHGHHTRRGSARSTAHPTLGPLSPQPETHPAEGPSKLNEAHRSPHLVPKVS